MSRNGRKVAFEHAAALPSFASLAEAEKFYFKLRNNFRETLNTLAGKNNIPLDYSPESLKTLEKWFFDLYESGGFKKLGISQKEFEGCMGIYQGYVYTENDPEFKWIVQESSFIKGKFQMGITKGYFALMLGGQANLPILKDNKRRQSMYREYKKYSQQP